MADDFLTAEDALNKIRDLVEEHSSCSSDGTVECTMADDVAEVLQEYDQNVRQLSRVEI